MDLPLHTRAACAFQIALKYPRNSADGISVVNEQYTRALRLRSVCFQSVCENRNGNINEFILFFFFLVLVMRGRCPHGRPGGEEAKGQLPPPPWLLGKNWLFLRTDI